MQVGLPYLIVCDLTDLPVPSYRSSDEAIARRAGVGTGSAVRQLAQSGDMRRGSINEVYAGRHPQDHQNRAW